jgi:ubiquinone/menaquinone biosynthesis C-methylase UbiE
LAAARQTFDDSRGYERSMGPWSRAAGIVFLDWLEAPTGARWLDAGCGTGAFTRLVADRSAPASVVAVDPAASQVAHAVAQRGYSTCFGVADAQALPFADRSFDVAAAALVFNFVPDPPRAIDELARVTDGDGLVAGYVWDFTAELSPTWPLRAALRETGIEAPAIPGAAGSSVAGLAALFDGAFQHVETRSIEAVVRFADFDDYWQSQMAVANPLTQSVAALTESERCAVMGRVRGKLEPSGGGLAHAARANAVKGSRPDA